MAGLIILDPGPLATIQDLGRLGYAHLGISPCGAADSFSIRVANRLAGNPDSAPVIEMTQFGATIRFDQDLVCAITGAGVDAVLGETAVPLWRAFPARRGTELSLGAFRNGARCYLAVGGGIDVPAVLGSAATDLGGEFGGLDGRALRRGDHLWVGKPVGSPSTIDARGLRYYVRPGQLRVTPGPQAGCFSTEAREVFFGSEYRVRDDSNRLGVRLAGTAVYPHAPVEIVTEGVSLGAVQIPPDGQPIILSVDRQTTGGYPKLCNVIAADLARVGQLAPRSSLRFTEVDLDTARAALQEREAQLETMLAEVR